LLANIFCTVVRSGATTPEDVLAGVGNDVLRRARWEPEPDRKAHFQAVLTALIQDRAGALAYVHEVIAWESLPYADKQRLKAERATQYRQAYMATRPATEKQQAFLTPLGYQGPKPANRALASGLIDQILARQRRGAP
jgi:hypothetical protein